MRFIHILRCPIEQIKTNEHARNSSAAFPERSRMGVPRADASPAPTERVPAIANIHCD